MQKGRDKMKKIILIVLLFLATGCSVDYELTIDDNLDFTENIAIQAENDIESIQIEQDPWPIKAYYSDPDSGEYPEKLEGIEYYNNQLNLNSNLYQKKLSYTFSKLKFKDANSIKSCYEHFYVMEDSKENTITISTSPKFLCMEDYPSLNKVNIIINVNQSVITSNADQINQNQYVWTITPQNYESRGIILTFKKSIQEENSNFEKENKKSSNIYLAFGILGVFIIAMIGIIIYKIKNSK